MFVFFCNTAYISEFNSSVVSPLVLLMVVDRFVSDHSPVRPLSRLSLEHCLDYNQTVVSHQTWGLDQNLLPPLFRLSRIFSTFPTLWFRSHVDPCV